MRGSTMTEEMRDHAIGKSMTAVQDHADTSQVTVLVVEDDPADMLILDRQLSMPSAVNVVLRCNSRVEDAVHRLRREHFDVVMLDMSLPDGEGLGNIDRILEADPKAAIIVLTGREDEKFAVDAVRRGAQDYLVKGQFDGRTLAKTIQYARERSRLRVKLDEQGEEESQAKNRFISHVSHELRTPLTAIHHFATILEEGIGGELTAKQLEFMAVLQRNVVHLKKMIGDLMDVTRLDTGKMVFDRSVVDVAELCANAIEAVAGDATQKNVRTRSVALNEIGRVAGDPVRLEQVFSNLLGNAVKFTPEGSEVVLELESDGDSVVVRVIDEGCGLPEGQPDSVFDRLFHDDRGDTSSRKGLGLGLYIAKEIVERHHGEISGRNRDGGGAEVSVRIPIYSLERTIRHGLFNRDGTKLSLVGVSVEHPADGGASRSVDHALREARRVLDDCTIGVSDVVLPAAYERGEVQFVIALAACDATGAHTITERVDRELNSRGAFRGPGVSARVTSLEIPSADGEVERTVRCVVDGLEQLMNDAATKGK